MVGLQTKVRDVKFCRDTLKLASLSADGFVKLWDPNLSLVQSVSNRHFVLLLCLEGMTPPLACNNSQHGRNANP